MKFLLCLLRLFALADTNDFPSTSIGLTLAVNASLGITASPVAGKTTNVSLG